MGTKADQRKRVGLLNTLLQGRDMSLVSRDEASAMAKEMGALKYLECSAMNKQGLKDCLLYTSPSPRDRTRSRMPSSA